MKKVFFLLLVVISAGLKAQVTDSVQTLSIGDTVFVDVMPEYPGGMQAMYTFLGENIKYPKNARKKKIEGTVYVKFIVDEDGDVINPVVIKGIGGGCDEEVIRVVNLMPKWTPGEQFGKKAAVYYTLPCKFSLNK